MPELHHHGSSACAAKVRLALDEKRLEWKGHYLDILRGEQFDPAYLKINPKGVVPTLVHDGRVIPESTVICEYLDEVFPARSIYPRSAYERALVRVWTKAVDEELHPACSAITYVASHRHTIMRSGVGDFEEFLRRGAGEGTAARTLKWQWIQQGIDAPGVADKISLYHGYLRKMEDALRASDWLVGDQFSMADIAMTPYVNRLEALAMGEVWRGGRLPRVDDWFERVKARPAFKTAMIDWMPQELSDEMMANGRKTWPEVARLLAI